MSPTSYRAAPPRDNTGKRLPAFRWTLFTESPPSCQDFFCNSMGIRKMPPDDIAAGQRQANGKTASSCRKAIPDGACTGERHVAAGAGSVPSRFRLLVSKTACGRRPAQSAASMTVLCNELLRARQNPQMTLTCCPAPVILGEKIPDRIFCCRPAFAHSPR